MASSSTLETRTTGSTPAATSVARRAGDADASTTIVMTGVSCREQGRPQHVETDGAEVEGPAVEVAQVEAVALADADLLAQVEPRPLADLVGDRLARPPEVALELEPQRRVRHPGVRAQEGPCLVGVPGPAADLLRRGEAAVDPDVDDDAGRPQR